MEYAEQNEFSNYELGVDDYAASLANLYAYMPHTTARRAKIGKVDLDILPLFSSDILPNLATS